MAYSWGYCKENGPHTWPEHFPAAKGTNQTPIDIVPSEAVYDATLKDKQIKYTYVPANSKSVTNNGHSFQVAIDGTGSLLEGGPLKNKFRIEQFHFHWGKTSSTGSEHRINGQMYAAELHLVHWNTDQFASFGEAAAANNGLCVLGVFVQAGKEHTGLKKITDLLPKIKYAGDKVDIEGGFDPACMLPSDTSKYWTYSGSLTTPPCYESVNWIVFKEPIEMSEAQLNNFRSLVSYKKDVDKLADDFGGLIIENYRPPLPLAGRQVRSSFN